MRVVLQRVRSARLTIADRTVAQIGAGVVLLVGIGPQDGEMQARQLVEKIAYLRIFGHGGFSIYSIRGCSKRTATFFYRCCPTGNR